MTIRIFLVDDHELVRRGIAGLVEAEADMELVGEASTAAQARSRIAAVRPDVAVLDVRLPDGSGVDVCRDLRSTMPDLRCIMLTGYDDDEALLSAVIAGAAGYVLKNIGGSGLVDGIRRAAAGHSLLDPDLARRVTERMKGRDSGDPRLESLGLRERQILSLIADGLTNREIGERLSLAEKTIKNYVSSVLSKLGLQRRTQAAVMLLDASGRSAGSRG